MKVRKRLAVGVAVLAIVAGLAETAAANGATPGGTRVTGTRVTSGSADG